MTGRSAGRRAKPAMDRSALVHALTHTPIVLNTGADPTPVGGSRPLSGTEANDVADLLSHRPPRGVRAGPPHAGPDPRPFHGSIREVRPVDDASALPDPRDVPDEQLDGEVLPHNGLVGTYRGVRLFPGVRGRHRRPRRRPLGAVGELRFYGRVSDEGTRRLFATYDLEAAVGAWWRKGLTS
jgi:hypothetical protein